MEDSNISINVEDLSNTECECHQKIYPELEHTNSEIEDDSETEDEEEALPELELEPELEQEYDEEMQSDDEFEEEWEEEWESDSGRDSPLESEEYESEEYSYWETDSGLQTVSESDEEMEPEWEDVPEPMHEEEPEAANYTYSDTDSEMESEDDVDPCRECLHEYPKIVCPYGEILILGPFSTRLPRLLFESIPWRTYEETTSIMLSLLFSEEVLATHTLNGTLVEFNGWPIGENRLSPHIIGDIMFLVCPTFNVNQQDVGRVIESVCAESSRKLERLIRNG